MNTVTRTLLILLLAALALGACGKHTHTPDDSDQPALIGFAPMSQEAMVKAGANEFPHSDFGVWGIARKTGAPATEAPYNLWGSGMTEVSYVDDSENVFAPERAAYWLKGYTYNFIAVAPYEVAATIPSTSILPGTTPGTERLSFTFDMASKYTSGDYDFDLMAAVAQAQVTTSASNHPSSQDLTFWHLLSQINIFVSFSTDLAGEPIEGKITRVKLGNILPSADYYTISSSGANVLNVGFSGAKGTPVNVDAAIPADRQSPSQDPNYTIHIIPQLVKTMTLYLDLAINEGSDNWVEYQNVKINLDVPANATAYTYNGKYNWKITIGTGASIKFNVTVGGWSNGATGDPIEM